MRKYLNVKNVISNVYRKTIKNTHASLLVHTGVKSFHCEICRSKFTRKNDLKQYLLTDTDEKPCECEMCGSKFTQNG